MNQLNNSENKTKTLWETVNKETGWHKKHITPDIDVDLVKNFSVTHASSIVAIIENSGNPSLNNHRFGIKHFQLFSPTTKCKWYNWVDKKYQIEKTCIKYMK